MQISTFLGSRSGSLSALALVLSCAAVGCAYGNTQQVVRAQFASELSCPQAHAEPTKRYDEGYKEGQLVVEGCGVMRIYDCPADAGLVSYDDHLCSFVVVNAGGDKPAVAAPPPGDAMSEGGDDPALAEPPAEEPSAPAADAKPHAKASGKASGSKASGKLKVGIGN